MQCLVEVSARHVHLSQRDVEQLFGKGYMLTKKKALRQLGQYVCEETVVLVGPRQHIERVAVLGPVREESQVEITITDTYTLGIRAPIRESGDLIQSGRCKLIGPVGQVAMQEGVIVARRHLHANPYDGIRIGVKDGQKIGVKVVTRDRSLTFEDVVVRINPCFTLAMHIDTDEANAVGWHAATYGEIMIPLE